MMTALASGMLLGLSCGLAPGPLMALVLAHTLRHGVREGCKIALSPLITDAPIIVLTALFAAHLAGFRRGAGIISLAGAVFVLYLAWDTFRVVRPDTVAGSVLPQSWFKGIVTNLASPHPWLFWLTVGAAALTRAIAESWLAAAAFLGGFYLLLVGSKLLLALLAARSRQLLAGRPYRVVMRILAVFLVGFAWMLFREGWRHLAAG